MRDAPYSSSAKIHDDVRHPRWCCKPSLLRRTAPGLGRVKTLVSTWRRERPGGLSMRLDYARGAPSCLLQLRAGPWCGYTRDRTISPSSRVNSPSCFAFISTPRRERFRDLAITFMSARFAHMSIKRSISVVDQMRVSGARAGFIPPKRSGGSRSSTRKKALVHDERVFLTLAHLGELPRRSDAAPRRRPDSPADVY